VGGNDGRRHYDPPWRCLGLAFSLGMIGAWAEDWSSRWREQLLSFLIPAAMAFAIVFVLGTLLSIVLEVIALFSDLRRRWRRANDEGSESGDGWVCWDFLAGSVIHS